jgi:hypothetical protein
MDSPKTLRTFFYHNVGQDTNGNFGPMPTEPGWHVVVGYTAEEAAKHLPAKAQKKIAKEMIAAKKYNEDMGLLEWAGLTCTWGWKFSFMDQVNWDAFVENNDM